MKKLAQWGLVLSRGPIARNSIQSVVIRVAGLAISFAQAILAARILGVQGYGIASVAMSAVQIAATFAVLGFGPLAVREVAQQAATGKTSAIREFLHTSTRWVTVLAVLAGTALSAVALTGLMPDDYRPTMLVSGLVVLPIALLQLQRGIAQGLGRIVAAQAPGELLRPILFVAFLTLVASVGAPLDSRGYLTAFAAAAFAALALSLPSTLRGIPASKTETPNVVERRRWRAEAMPFLGIAFVGMLLGEINTLILGWLTTPREAGLFQPVARLVPLMVLPAQVVAVAFAPRVAELWTQGKHAQVQRLTHLFTLVTSAMTLFIVGMLIFAAPLIMHAFGREFLPIAALLWIIGLAQLINAAAGPVGHLLSMTGFASIALRGQLAALSVNLLLGVILIPSQGAQGAAIAMAAGLIVWNLVLLACVRQRLGFDPSLPSALMRVLLAR